MELALIAPVWVFILVGLIVFALIFIQRGLGIVATNLVCNVYSYTPTPNISVRVLAEGRFLGTQFMLYPWTGVAVIDTATGGGPVIYPNAGVYQLNQPISPNYGEVICRTHLEERLINVPIFGLIREFLRWEVIVRKFYAK